MLKWPARAVGAVVKLFEPLQDIDVYVEDVEDEVFYTSLLKNAAQDRLRISRVFALGNRLKVIRAAQEYSPSGRRSLFIIDGDLEWVKDIGGPRLPWLYRLNAYCIENLILRERAAFLILSEELVIDESKATEALNFRHWTNSIEPHLVELFAAYATVHTFKPSYKTVSNGVGILCTKSGTTTKLDLRKVANAKAAALAEAEKIVSPETVRQYYERILFRAKNLEHPSLVVSGKDFLLPLFEFHIQSKGCRIKKKSLRLKLAKNCNPQRLVELKNAMLVNAS
ncbi:DUF4435 domain-containing protein [Pseudomonas sediminis]|uniref:DUF4435 domain-containing protein n=1 Tax=Pseudomonas sediminis TaxID=1691904 RepID=A0ABX6SHS2_9PSED|nr:DUF4435 domain-containing protein [Pseudomonas sediminis]QNH00394.1 DUF4435 domain-containing protein [Pseudomonas sediminis]